MKKLQLQRSSVILWSIVVFLLLVIAISMFLRRIDEPLEMPPEKAIPVKTVTVAREQVTDRIELPGRIEADLRARLAVDKGGRVTERLVDRGDHVQAGDPLLRLDDRIWRTLEKNAEIEWDEAQRDYKRWTELAEADAVSVSEYDTVRARYDRARVRRDEARIHVEQCTVNSPADGIINDRFIEVGEFAAEGTAVLELVVSNPAKLVLHVPEQELRAVSKGTEIEFQISVVGDRLFTGTVTHVAEAAAPANTSFRTEASVPNDQGTLRPGMIAKAWLLRGRREDAVVVPLAAVIPRAGEHLVFVAEEGRAVRRLVKIDRILDSSAILASGLQPGEELVVEGHRDLIDGSLIKNIGGPQQSEGEGEE